MIVEKVSVAKDEKDAKSRARAEARHSKRDGSFDVTSTLSTSPSSPSLRNLQFFRPAQHRKRSTSSEDEDDADLAPPTMPGASNSARRFSSSSAGKLPEKGSGHKQQTSNSSIAPVYLEYGPRRPSMPYASQSSQDLRMSDGAGRSASYTSASPRPNRSASPAPSAFTTGRMSIIYPDQERERPRSFWSTLSRRQNQSSQSNLNGYGSNGYMYRGNRSSAASTSMLSLAPSGSMLDMHLGLSMDRHLPPMPSGASPSINDLSMVGDWETLDRRGAWTPATTASRSPSSSLYPACTDRNHRWRAIVCRFRNARL